MPYDPQRSHRRPRLADDAPAPIDALLGDGPGADAPEVHGRNGDRAAPVKVESTSAAPGAPVSAVPTDADLVAGSGRGRPRVAVLAVAVIVLLLVLAWARRRR
jgi:hypothetical protein